MNEQRCRCAGERVTDEPIGIGKRRALVNRVVDHSRRREIAAAEARDRPHVDIAWTSGSRARLERSQQRAATIQVTTHVVAHAHFRSRWRLQIKMRIETRDALQVEQREIETRSERAKLVRGKVPVPLLYRSQLVENWRVMR